MRRVIDPLLQVIPTVLVVSLIAFLLTSLLPGDAALSRLGLDATQEQLDTMREQMGLNDPAPVRYVYWLGRAVTGDLGNSLRSGEPVVDVLARRIPVTLELAVFGTGVALLFGVPLGILAAVRRDSWIDVATNLFALSGMAIPFFWLGLLLIMFFSRTCNGCRPRVTFHFSRIRRKTFA